MSVHATAFRPAPFAERLASWSPLESLLETPLETWWSWIVPLSLQALVLVLLALLFERAFARRARPHFLFALWGCLLLRLLVPPGLEGPLPEAALHPLGSQVLLAHTAQSNSALPFCAFVLWCAGIVTLLLVLLGRARRLRSALRGERVAALEERMTPLVLRACTALGLRRRLQLEVRVGAPGPLACGVLRPRVVFPATFVRAENDQRLEAALLHELAHVARRDALRAGLLRCVLLLFWFHPAAWLAIRRLRALAEAGADARAARALAGGSQSYRRALAGLARRVLEQKCNARLEGTFGLAGHGRELSARLAWLDPEQRGGRRRRAGELAVLAAFLGACLPLANPRSEWTTRLTELLGAEPPALDELEGCLQRRYLLFGLSGDAEFARASEPANKLSEQATITLDPIEEDSR